MTPLLTVDGLVLRFGGVTALAGVSFTVEAGERVALVGPNGAGKTSVLNCISGVERPTRGRVLIGGRDLAGMPPSRRAAMGVARTLQGLGVIEDLDVVANLRLGRHHLMRAGLLSSALRLPRARAEEASHRCRAEAMADELGLAGDLRTPAHRLGPGARKRLELGRALAADGSLLLLDEPFAGAGPDDVALMVPAILRATGGSRAAAVIVDHDLPTVMGLAGRAVALDAGRLAAAA